MICCLIQVNYPVVSASVSVFLICHTTELLWSPNTKYLSQLVSQSGLEICVHEGRCNDGLIVTVRLLNPSRKKENEGSRFYSFSLCDNCAIRKLVVTRSRSPQPGSWLPADYIALLVCYVFHLWTHTRPNVWLSSQPFDINQHSTIQKPIITIFKTHCHVVWLAILLISVKNCLTCCTYIYWMMMYC